MTYTTGAMNKRAPDSGAPGWRPLTMVVALVVAAHFLVLQASPAHLGTGADDAGGKAFSTRSIELAAAPAPEVAPTIKPAPKSIEAAKNTQKPPLTQATDQEIRTPAAPESVAKPDPLPLASLDPIPLQPTESTASTTSTQASVVSASADGSKTTPVTAVRLPGSVRLLYKMVGMAKNLNYQADAELEWKTDGEKYEAMMKVSAFLVGSRSMTSVGNITGTGLAPARFADKFRNELAAHFEPEKGKITFSANTPDAPWIEGVQDRVSVFIQLGGIVAAKPQDFPPGSSITFLTIGPREADTWTFVIEAEETLSLMGAPMPTLKLTRKPRREFDQKVEIWFSPSLGYLPVRNRITQQNGDFIDQQLVEIVRPAKPVAP